MSTTAKPAPPKRPLNAVFKYKQEKFDSYRKEHVGKKLAEITTELCAQYKKLPEKEKQRYEEEYKKELEKFRKDKEDYEEKHGKIVQVKKKAKKGKEDKSEEKPKKKSKSADKKKEKPGKSADKKKK